MYPKSWSLAVESGLTGSYLTVDTPTSSTSWDTVGNGLVAMSFTIDGMVFDLANATSAGVGNNNGPGTPEVLNTISYTGESDSFVFQLSTGGFTDSFSDSANSSLNSGGTITATLTPAVPEPSTWAMMILDSADSLYGVSSSRSNRFRGVSDGYCHDLH